MGYTIERFYFPISNRCACNIHKRCAGVINKHNDHRICECVCHFRMYKNKKRKGTKST